MKSKIYLSAVFILTASLSGAEVFKFEETGEGSASKYEPSVLAEKRAEENALSKALNKAGVDVFYGYHDLMAQGGASGQFIASTLNVFSGGLADFERTGKPQYENTSDGGVTCRIKIKGKVTLKGKPDPSFEAKLLKDDGMNRPVYLDGESVKLGFSASKDCYVHIISVDENKNAALLYPNSSAVLSKYKAGSRFVFPDKESNLNMQAVLPSDRAEVVELVQIVLTKNKPLFAEAEIAGTKAGEYKQLAIGDISALYKRLSLLDRSDWTILNMPYEIRKK